MKRRILLLLAFALVLCGCSDYRKLQVNSYSLDGMQRLSMMNGKVGSIMRLSLNITNPTDSRFVMKEFHATLYEADGDRFAEAVSTGECTIEPNFSGFVPVELDVTLFRPMSMFLSKPDYSNMTADVNVVAKQGIARIRYKKKGVPLSSFIKRFGPPDNR